MLNFGCTKYIVNFTDKNRPDGWLYVAIYGLPTQKRVLADCLYELFELKNGRTEAGPAVRCAVFDPLHS